MVEFVMKNRARFMFEVFDLVEKQRNSNLKPLLLFSVQRKKMKWETSFLNFWLIIYLFGCVFYTGCIATPVVSHAPIEAKVWGSNPPRPRLLVLFFKTFPNSLFYIYLNGCVYMLSCTRSSVGIPFHLSTIRAWVQTFQGPSLIF